MIEQATIEMYDALVGFAALHPRAAKVLGGALMAACIVFAGMVDAGTI